VNSDARGGLLRLINLVAKSAGLRQGDVLSVIGEEPAPYGAQLCVVITADCDLAQDKHYGQVLLCPIISAASYYEVIWCAKRLESFREKVLRRLRKEVDGLSDKRILMSPLSERAFEIICSSEVSLRQALAELQLSSGKVEELARQVASLEKCGETSSNLLALVAGIAHGQKKDASSVRENIFSDFKLDLAKDAIDIVVVHDDLSGHDVVHVVLLRAPFSIPVQQISLDSNGKEGAHCRRVGRFAPEIKFLIAQKFGTLFSRVGMKNEIEHDRNAAIELLEDHV
jgi:hypothetical protein